MDQLELTQAVRVEGRDFWGRRTMMGLGPNKEKTGWIWNAGGIDIPIVPEMIQSKPRRTAVVWGCYTLNEFEHIGILRAAGLQHVRLYTQGGSVWPPYDGGPRALWSAVMPHTKRSGSLQPYRLPYESSAVLPYNNTRYVVYRGDGNDRDFLRITGALEFPRLQKDPHRFGWQYGRDDICALVGARTLGWPPSLYHLSRLAHTAGWPHHARIAWPQTMATAQLLCETADHRLVDMLGVLNFAAPTGHYLAGSLHSVKGNHATDIALLHALARGEHLALRAVA